AGEFFHCHTDLLPAGRFFSLLPQNAPTPQETGGCKPSWSRGYPVKVLALEKSVLFVYPFPIDRLATLPPACRALRDCVAGLRCGNQLVMGGVEWTRSGKRRTASISPQR